MVYFPLILIFCQRWTKDFGIGSLAATMLPYSMGLLVAGLALVIGWAALDLPLGPGAGVHIDPNSFTAPAQAAPGAPAAWAGAGGSSAASTSCSSCWRRTMRA